MGDDKRTYVGFDRNSTSYHPPTAENDSRRAHPTPPPPPALQQLCWEQHPAVREQQRGYRGGNHRPKTARWASGHGESGPGGRGAPRSVRRRIEGPQSVSGRSPAWEGREHIAQQHHMGHANSWGNAGHGRMAQVGVSCA